MVVRGVLEFIKIKKDFVLRPRPFSAFSVSDQCNSKSYLLEVMDLKRKFRIHVPYIGSNQMI